MQRFSMIATGEIDCIGLSAMPSDRLDVSAVQASVLLRKRLARFATDEDDVEPEPPPPPAPEPEPVMPVRKRRTYRTRAMRAEG